MNDAGNCRVSGMPVPETLEPIHAELKRVMPLGIATPPTKLVILPVKVVICALYPDIIAAIFRHRPTRALCSPRPRWRSAPANRGLHPKCVIGNRIEVRCLYLNAA